LRVVAAGVSGFLGTALRDALARQGHEVVTLVRGTAAGPSQSRWDPYAGDVDRDLIAAADAVVNLAGAPIARWPWTESYKRTLLESRVQTTRTLARALVDTADSAPRVWLNASGVGAYGEGRGDEVLTEDSPLGAGFLAEVVRQWEGETQPAQDAGVRVCLLRTSVVLDRSGGALRPMLVPFRLGGGARFGTGDQYFSVISLRDWVSATLHLLADAGSSGAVNLALPEPPTNREFTEALARQLHRPALFALPAAPLRMVLGELSNELLGSLRVVPQRLAAAGFSFADPDVSSALATAMAPRTTPIAG
jgi:hypothetical protein